MKDEKIQIGKIVNAVGLRGEVKVYNYSDPDRYDNIKSLLVEDKRYNVKSVRYQANMVILKLEGVNDRNAAETLKDKYLYVFESELPELPEDTYYIRDLVGMDVVDEENNKVGVLCDVIQNSAQDVYEIQLENGKKGYIPGVSNFILNIDLDNKVIKVRLIEGLLD